MIQLEKEILTSSRQIERLFKEYIGITIEKSKTLL